MRLRQIVLAVHDLPETESRLTSLFGLNVGARDAGVKHWGLTNFLLPVGGDFLEAIAPERDGTAVSRFLERRGEGGYMVILQCDDGLASRERITALGVRLIWEKFDDDDYVPSQYHPADCNGTILGVSSVGSADRHEPLSRWPPAHDDWHLAVDTSVTQAITAVYLQSGDPEATARHWSAMLDLPCAIESDNIAITLDNGHLRFSQAPEGQPDGIAAIELSVSDPASVLKQASGLGLQVTDNSLRMNAMTWQLVPNR